MTVIEKPKANMPWLLWLALAAAAPAPRPVKNITLAVSATWHGREDDLQFALIALSGVEAVKLSADKQTVYIKAMQKGFDEAAAKKIISGA